MLGADAIHRLHELHEALRGVELEGLLAVHPPQDLALEEDCVGRRCRGEGRGKGRGSVIGVGCRRCFQKDLWEKRNRIESSSAEPADPAVGVAAVGLAMVVMLPAVLVVMVMTVVVVVTTRNRRRRRKRRKRRRWR